MLTKVKLIRELNELGKDVVSKYCDWYELSSEYALYVKEKETNETFFVQFNFLGAKLYKAISDPTTIYALKHDWYGDRIFLEPEKFESRTNWRGPMEEFWVFEKTIPVSTLLLSFNEGKKEECSQYELLYHTQNFMILSDKNRTKLMKFGTGYDYECVEFSSSIDATKIVDAIHVLRTFGGNYKTETLLLGDYRISIRVENGKTGLLSKHDTKVNIRWNEDKKRAFRLIQEKKEPLPF